ncbi:unnamed protein product [Discosporangium mesarthrocarpum]
MNERTPEDVVLVPSLVSSPVEAPSRDPCRVVLSWCAATHLDVLGMHDARECLVINLHRGRPPAKLEQLGQEGAVVIMLSTATPRQLSLQRAQLGLGLWSW